MRNYALYDDAGYIISIITTTPEEIATVAKMMGADFLPCGVEINDSTHYVKDREIQKRQIFTPTYTVEGLRLIIYGIPAGLLVTVTNLRSSVVADSSPTEIEFDTPGRYIICVNGSPEYIEYYLEIEIG